MNALEEVSRRIFTLRGRRVILDSDLAALYGVETRALLQAVRRNAARYPCDFMFAMTNQEVTSLRSQFVISKPTGRGGRRYGSLAFTEHGAIMAAAVLKSARAIEVSVFVVRAFVQMREVLATGTQIGKRLDELERKVGTHDRAILEILQAIRQLTQPPEASRRKRIGFV